MIMRLYNVFGFVGYLISFVIAVNYIFPSPLLALIIILFPLSVVFRCLAWLFLYLHKRFLLHLFVAITLAVATTTEMIVMMTGTTISTILTIWIAYSVIELMGFISLYRYQPIFVWAALIIPAIVVSYAIFTIQLSITTIEDIYPIIRYIQTIGFLMALSAISAAVGFLTLKVMSRVS